MQTTSRIATLVFFLITTSANAMAFLDTFDMTAGNDAGSIQAGDILNIIFHLENGGTTTENQTWTGSQIKDVTITDAASAYTIMFAPPWWDSNSYINTDSTGIVIDSGFNGTSENSIVRDKYGAVAMDALMGTTEFYTTLGIFESMLDEYSDIPFWNDILVGTQVISDDQNLSSIPEPTTLALICLSAVVMSFVRHRSARA